MRKPLSVFEYWMILLTILAILVAGVTGIAIYWQAQISAETLAEIKKGGTYTHELAVASKEQSEGTKSIAEAAKSQATTTNGQLTVFRSTERAYVSVKGI